MNRILLFLLLLAQIAQGQADSCSYSISGKIIDEDTQEPLPFVTVQVKNSFENTLTDEQGDFVIENLCQANNTILISCFGYCDSVCTHFHQHDHNAIIELKNNYITLNEVVVTVEPRKKSGTNTISQVALKKADFKSSLNLSEALNKVAGVSFISSGPNAKLPMIHGLYGNRILLLNNEFKHSFQNWGNDHAPEIDLQQFDKITLIKGAAGVKYGAEALGGALVLEPNPLNLHKKTTIDAQTGFSSNGRGITQQLNLSQGGHHFAYQVGGSYQRFGDRHTPTYNLSNTGKEEIGLQGGIRYHNNKIDIQSRYSFVSQNLGLLTSSIVESGDLLVESLKADEPIIINDFTYQINAPRQQSNHHFFNTTFKYWYKADASIKLLVGLQQNDRKEFDIRRSSDRPIIDLQLRTQDWKLIWDHAPFMQLDGEVGIQYFNQNNDNIPGTLTTPFIPNYNTNRLSAFAIEKWKNPKITWETGLRLDWETSSVRGRETNQELFTSNFNFLNLTGSFGFSKPIGKRLKLQSNIGTAWRTPNMAELYSFGQRGFRTTYGLLRYVFENDKLKNEIRSIQEADIDPERSVKWVSELEYQHNNIQWKATFFANYIENFVFNRPINIISTIRGPMPLFITDQANAAMAGLDFSASFPVGKNNAGASISYLYSQNVERNEMLIQQPPVRIDANFLWNLPHPKSISDLTIDFRPSYTFEPHLVPRIIDPESIINNDVRLGSEVETFDFVAPPSGYFLMDILATVSYKQFDVSLGVQNVFNQRYRNYLNSNRYFADELGRNFNILINYKFTRND